MLDAAVSAYRPSTRNTCRDVHQEALSNLRVEGSRACISDYTIRECSLCCPFCLDYFHRERSSRISNAASDGTHRSGFSSKTGRHKGTLPICYPFPNLTHHVTAQSENHEMITTQQRDPSSLTHIALRCIQHSHPNPASQARLTSQSAIRHRPHDQGPLCRLGSNGEVMHFASLGNTAATGVENELGNPGVSALSREMGGQGWVWWR